MTDPSGALAQRMLILETRHSWAGKEDRKLTTKLAAELPGILRWAIYGWRRLRKRGHFRQPKSSKHLVEQYGLVPLTRRVKEVLPVRAVAMKTVRPPESWPFNTVNVSWNDKAMQITILNEKRYGDL
jgi:hypothetical protein